MRAVTRRKACQLGGMGLLALCGGVVAGCSASPEVISGAVDDGPQITNTAQATGSFWETANGVIPAAAAFRQEGVWFSQSNDKTIAKDTLVTQIHQFHGDGTVTSWNVYDQTGATKICYSDLDGLTDDEILKLAREHWAFKADRFEELKQERIQRYQSKAEQFGGNFETVLQRLQTLEPISEPEPHEYQLKIITDDSGNRTKKEGITLIIPGYPGIISGEGLSALDASIAQVDGQEKLDHFLESYFTYSGYKQTWELDASNKRHEILSSTYAGYESIVMRYDGPAEFGLDEPGTDGVEVD